MEPGDSGGVAAVEVAVDPPVPTFVHGACAGIAFAAIAAHCWLAITLAPLRDAYRDMGSASPPLVLQPTWMWGVPAAGLVALAVLVIRRPRSLVPYGCAAAVLVATAIATWHFAYAPLWEMSGNISG
jgi:hypothetical protein